MNNRWEAFSDEELSEIYTILLGRHQGAVFNEIADELHRRDNASDGPTYQGPGFYFDRANGTTLQVVTRTAIAQVPHLLIGKSLDDPNLWALEASKLEKRNQYGTRRYEYREWK